MRKILKIFACILIILAIPIAVMILIHVDFSNDKNLDVFIRTKMKAAQARGMAVAFIKDKEISWSRNYGFADTEGRKEVTDETIFHIASVSKTVTGAAIMQLYEQGLVDLDASINQYLPFQINNPNFPDEKITVRMLLQHNSSLIDNETAYRSTFTVFTGSPDPDMTLEQFVKAYYLAGGSLYDQESNFSQSLPGITFSYSNAAFGILGYIVEYVTKQAFNVYCTEHIFAPLGMQSTGWMSTDVNLENLAVQYDGGTRLEPYSMASYPDGALKTSVKDYSKFMIAMMNGGSYKGQRILKESSVNEMMPENPADNLAWASDVLDPLFIDTKDQHLQGHLGGDPGSATFAGFNPDNGNGVIVFINGAPAMISPSPLLFLKMMNYRSIYKRLAKEAGLF